MLVCIMTLWMWFSTLNFPDRKCGGSQHFFLHILQNFFSFTESPSWIAFCCNLESKDTCSKFQVWWLTKYYASALVQFLVPFWSPYVYYLLGCFSWGYCLTLLIQAFRRPKKGPLPKNEKSKQKKCKKHEKHYTNECFFTKSQKPRNRNICVLCHDSWPDYNLDMLSTSKWQSDPQFCERHLCSWQKITRNGP